MSLDLDDFDMMEEPYKQLIVWDPDVEAILGGYRYLLGAKVKLREDGLYERMEENFREITMPSEQVEKLLSESGFEVLEVREYLTNREPGAQSDKLLFCARKK